MSLPSPLGLVCGVLHHFLAFNTNPNHKQLTSESMSIASWLRHVVVDDLATGESGKLETKGRKNSVGGFGTFWNLAWRIQE